MNLLLNLIPKTTKKTSKITSIRILSAGVNLKKWKILLSKALAIRSMLKIRLKRNTLKKRVISTVEVVKEMVMMKTKIHKNSVRRKSNIIKRNDLFWLIKSSLL